MTLSDQPAVGPSPHRPATQTFRSLTAATADKAGEEFFRQLVKHVAVALDVSYAFVAEFAGSPTRVRTIALWGEGSWLDNVEYDLAGTPCEEVVRGSLCRYENDVHTRFPEDKWLTKIGARGYLGVPLRAADGRTLGHLAHPGDVEKAALDHPDLNFIIYHSALKHGTWEPEFKDPSYFDPTTGDLIWHAELMKIKQRHPKMNNVYPEIGSSFGLLAIAHPVMITSGQQGRARRRAHGGIMEAIVGHALFGQPAERGCLDHTAKRAWQCGPDIVEHDNDDVGCIGGKMRLGRQRTVCRLGYRWARLAP